jgi:hypothetical protein
MGRRQISEAVQAHLRGFTERNRERAAKRRQQLATSLSGDLPVKRPWFDAVRVVNPTLGTQTCGCCGLAGLASGCPNCLPSWCAECGACRAHCQCQEFEAFQESSEERAAGEVAT